MRQFQRSYQEYVDGLTPEDHKSATQLLCTQYAQQADERMVGRDSMEIRVRRPALYAKQWCVEARDKIEELEKQQREAAVKREEDNKLFMRLRSNDFVRFNQGQLEESVTYSIEEEKRRSKKRQEAELGVERAIHDLNLLTEKLAFERDRRALQTSAMRGLLAGKVEECTEKYRKVQTEQGLPLVTSLDKNSSSLSSTLTPRDKPRKPPRKPSDGGGGEMYLGAEPDVKVKGVDGSSFKHWLENGELEGTSARAVFQTEYPPLWRRR